MAGFVGIRNLTGERGKCQHRHWVGPTHAKFLTRTVREGPRDARARVEGGGPVASATGSMRQTVSVSETMRWRALKRRRGVGLRMFGRACLRRYFCFAGRSTMVGDFKLLYCATGDH